MKFESKMIIANPIYDVVFKYLLEDIEIAHELLSTILGVRLSHFSVKPREVLQATIIKDNAKFQLDFNARIDLPNEKQQTLSIEVIKVKKKRGISGFPKDLSEIQGNSSKKIIVYILGFKLEGVEASVLKIKAEGKYIDVVNQKKVQTDNKFISYLPQGSCIIQIPRVKLKQQNILEQVLEIFSQDYWVDDFHELDYTGNTTNLLVKKMLDRLTKAIDSRTIVKQMGIEDYIDRLITRALLNEEQLDVIDSSR